MKRKFLLLAALAIASAGFIGGWTARADPDAHAFIKAQLTFLNGVEAQSPTGAVK